MSEQDNIRIVKDIYDAVGRGDVDAILERVTDDVDWAAEVAENAAPVAWTTHRQARRRQLLQGHQHQHRDHGVHTAQLRGRHDDVHLLVDWTFRPIANGRQTSMTMHHYWQLRDGKVVRFRGSEDSALTAHAFAR